MNIEKPTLEPAEGFPKGIGYYLSGMEEVREQLRKAVNDLSNAEISAKFTPDSHSIGQLILHNGEAEWWWIQTVVAQKELDEEEIERRIIDELIKIFKEERVKFAELEAQYGDEVAKLKKQRENEFEVAKVQEVNKAEELSEAEEEAAEAEALRKKLLGS